MTPPPGQGTGAGPGESDADPAPVSVRIGNVVPPEDAEDWTRPLTWLAAVGMLAGPLGALLWFVAGPPQTSSEPLAATWLVAAALAAGAALTGATQIGSARAFAGTAGAALFGALGTVVLGVIFSVERQVGAASPTLAHAVVAAAAGLAGTAAVATLAPALARHPARAWRVFAPGALGAVASALVVQLLFTL